MHALQLAAFRSWVPKEPNLRKLNRQSTANQPAASEATAGNWIQYWSLSEFIGEIRWSAMAPAKDLMAIVSFEFGDSSSKGRAFAIDASHAAESMGSSECRDIDVMCCTVSLRCLECDPPRRLKLTRLAIGQNS